MSRIGKSIETENRLAVPEPGARGEMGMKGSDSLMGIGVPLRVT